MNSEKAKPGGGWPSVVKYAIVSATLLVLAWLTFLATVDRPQKTVNNVINKVDNALDKVLDVAGKAFKGHKKEKVDSTVLGGRSVMMYALYEKEMNVVYRYSNTWGGSTKKMCITQKFRVRYGIDATLEGVNAKWGAPGVIKLENLTPGVITCERIGNNEIEEENGLWNRLQPEERADAQTALDEQARRDAGADAAALECVRRRVLDALNGEAQDVQFQL